MDGSCSNSPAGALSSFCHAEGVLAAGVKARKNGWNGSDDMSMCISTGQAHTNETPHTEILPRRSLSEILPRDLFWRSCSEILPRDLLQRSCEQSSFRALVHRSCQETSSGNLLQRPGEEGRGLLRRSFIDSLNRDLTLRSLTRSSVEISCRHLVPCRTQASCTEASIENIARRSCAQSSTEIFTKGTCRIWPAISSFHY